MEFYKKAKLLKQKKEEGYFNSSLYNIKFCTENKNVSYLFEL